MKEKRAYGFEPWRQLLEQMHVVIDNGNYTYDDVTTALGKLSTEVTLKGHNLLNTANIQEVMQMPMFRSSADDTQRGDHR